MNVVVTGSSGHLGKYVVHLLASQGHDVVAVARSGRYEAPFGAAPLGASAGKISHLSADIAEDSVVEVLAAALAAPEGPGAALVHLAAWHPPATASTTVADRSKLLATNVLGTMRVYEAARRAKASAVVYASTFEVYGEPRENPITEGSRVHPITDYGASKLAGEDHLCSLEAEDKIRGVSLRFPAIYGPGEHTPRAVPSFLAAVRSGKAPTLYGDGADQRDLIHVSDAARAIALALSSNVSGIFNVADGEAHTVGEIAKVAMKVAGLAGEPVFEARQKPRRDYHMSIAKAQAALGFGAQVALEAGLAGQLAWLRGGG